MERLTVELKRSPSGEWLARFSDWEQSKHLFGSGYDGFLPTPWFGPASFLDVADGIRAANSQPLDIVQTR